MADIQRPNYFTSQFLVEADFNEEQTYHRDMRLRHNRSLHEWGVVEGLEVSSEGDKEIKVTKGMAIDEKGREIVILPDSSLLETISLDGLDLNTTIELTIIYREIEENPYEIEIDGKTKYTRTNERPKFVIYDANTNQENLQEGNLDLKNENVPTNGTVIRLAQVTLDGSGNIITVDNSVRKFASAKLPSPRFLVGTVNTAENDGFPVPEGTNVDDWEIFVSLGELKAPIRPNTPVAPLFRIEVSARKEANGEGWRILCYAQALKQDGTDDTSISPSKGVANYMLLRK
ncbi:MAG: hypothetical protein AB4372_38275 [Xenococcus sp. (in: cyanobacteria)]